MRDYMKPQDLNTEGCILLVTQILRDAAQDYLHTRRYLRRSPDDANALAHMKHVKSFYTSDYFKALSEGMVDGETVMRELDRQVR